LVIRTSIRGTDTTASCASSTVKRTLSKSFGERVPLCQAPLVTRIT